MSLNNQQTGILSYRLMAGLITILVIPGLQMFMTLKRSPEIHQILD
jgi:hypothetical protein